MHRSLSLISPLTLIVLLLATPGFARGNGHGHGRGDSIDVMSQNQYLGADLGPVIAAPDAGAFNAALIDALGQIAANRMPERAERLAQLIARRGPDLVGQQEMFQFECFNITFFPGPDCSDPSVAGAFGDHLQATLDALDALGADYHVAGVVENLDLRAPLAPFLPPGLPLDLDLNGAPDITVTVLDRDVILARGDVDTRVVSFPCARPSADGCRFENVASVDTPAGPISIERGFVGVDATVRGAHYRFVNTHLEVMNLVDVPGGNPPGVVVGGSVQAAQASELAALIAGSLIVDPAPEGSQVILVGDINSSPEDDGFVDPLFDPNQPLLPPYAQLAFGLNLVGAPAPAAWTDAWAELPGNRPGYTCCQDADLRNRRSLLGERIDVIFSLEPPRKVRHGRVYGSRPFSKTWPSRLWPSDHGQPAVELRYD